MTTSVTQRERSDVLTGVLHWRVLPYASVCGVLVMRLLMTGKLAIHVISKSA